VRWAAALVSTALVLTLASVASAQQADKAAGASEAAATASGLRPYEAPLLGAAVKAPPPPAEYLKHDQDGVRFLYHPSGRERVRALVEMAAAVRAELASELGHDVLRSVDVRVAVGSADFARVLPEGAPMGSGVLAFAELSLLVLRLDSGAAATTSDVAADFRRGLAFLALDQASRSDNIPRWFRIGYAIHFSRQASMARARSLWWASMQQRFIPLVDLDWHLTDRAAYGSVAAAEASDFIRYLLEPERVDAFPRLMSQLRTEQSFAEAMRTAYQLDTEGLENAWRADVAKHKAFVPILLGGTGVSVLLALGVSLRRRLRKRGEEEENAVPKLKLAPVRKLKLKPHKRKRRKERKRMPTTEPPEPEVPKVSHNGRWHTLH
jgi:hypothetical protein